MGEPNRVRTGWLDTAKNAAALDRLVPILQAAAELCGVYSGDDTALLPLVIDRSNLHRRRVWEAWKAAGERCGRGSALAALGASIRAADLEGFEPYRKQKPLIRRQFPILGPGNRHIYRPVVIDSEDSEDYEEPKLSRKALAR